MKFSLIEPSGRVAQVVDGESGCFPVAKPLKWVECPPGVSPEYTFDGAIFRAPLVPTQAVPHSVTMRQARLALLNDGKLQAISDAIAALPSPQKEEAQIEWEYAQTVDRDAAFLMSVASAIGLDDAALDTLFTQAARL